MILTEAQRLFERDGYAATSMAAIAAAAGVALKTVYLSFDSKPGLLRAVWHRALRGDRDDVPVGEQDWFREVMNEPDPRRRLLLTARNSRLVKERAAAIMEVIHAAAPGDAGSTNCGTGSKPTFTPTSARSSRASPTTAPSGPNSTLRRPPTLVCPQPTKPLSAPLTTERRWSADRYEQWLGDLLATQLLPRGGARTGHTQVAS